MKIKDDVLAVLSRADVSGSKLFLTGQLDRKMYVDVNKVLEAAGGKWNKKEKAHVFDGDAFDRIDQIIVSGEVDIPKDEFEYFYTPANIVEKILAMAAMPDGASVLEPSAGQGHIAHKAQDAGAVVDCVELMDANFKAIDGKFNAVMQADFLTVEPKQAYDYVLMNPPFSKQKDIKHVMHAHKFLKDGGSLVAIMGAGVLFRENALTVKFREFVEANGGRFERLPEASFKESGTMVNTVVVKVGRAP